MVVNTLAWVKNYTKLSLFSVRLLMNANKFSVPTSNILYLSPCRAADAGRLLDRRARHLEPVRAHLRRPGVRLDVGVAALPESLAHGDPGAPALEAAPVASCAADLAGRRRRLIGAEALAPLAALAALGEL